MECGCPLDVSFEVDISVAADVDKGEHTRREGSLGEILQPRDHGPLSLPNACKSGSQLEARALFCSHTSFRREKTLW